MKRKHENLIRWRWMIIITLCGILMLALISSSWVWMDYRSHPTEDPSQVMLVENTP